MSFGDDESRQPLLAAERDFIRVPVANAARALTFDDFLTDPRSYLQRIMLSYRRTLENEGNLIIRRMLENERNLAINISLTVVSILTAVVGCVFSIIVAVNDILQNYYAGYAAGGSRCEDDILKGDAATAYCASNDCFAYCGDTIISPIMQPIGLSIIYGFFESMLIMSFADAIQPPLSVWKQPSLSLKMKILHALGLLLTMGAVLGLSIDWIPKPHRAEGFNAACIEKFAQLCPSSANSSTVCDLIDTTGDGANCFNYNKLLPPLVEFNQVFGVSQMYALLPVLALALFKIMLMLCIKKFKSDDPIMPRPFPLELVASGEWAWVYGNPLSVYERPRDQVMRVAQMFARHHDVLSIDSVRVFDARSGAEVELIGEFALQLRLSHPAAFYRRKAAVVAACFSGGCLGSVSAGAAGAGARLG